MKIVNINVLNVGKITNRYTRQSPDHSLQRQEFHLEPPALMLSGISTHPVFSGEISILKRISVHTVRCHLLVVIKYYIVTIAFCVATKESSNICVLTSKTLNCERVHPYAAGCHICYTIRRNLREIPSRRIRWLIPHEIQLCIS